MTHYLDFEKPLAEIEGKAEELRALARSNAEMEVDEEAGALDRKAAEILRDLYKALTPWRKCQVARHPERPHCRDYIAALFRIHPSRRGSRLWRGCRRHGRARAAGGSPDYGDRP